MNSIISLTLFVTVLFFASSKYTFANDYDDDDTYVDDDLPFVAIKSARDFSVLSEIAADNQQIIMLEVTASYCGYCELLEEEIIKPMLRSGNYADKVLIRQLDMDSFYNIVDFSGYKSTPNKIAKKYKVKVTPTLLFLNSEGEEVSKRILGVNSLDFFGGYVDAAINEGLNKVRDDDLL